MKIAHMVNMEPYLLNAWEWMRFIGHFHWYCSFVWSTFNPGLSV